MVHAEKNKKQRGFWLFMLITLAVLLSDQMIKLSVLGEISIRTGVYKNYGALFGVPIDIYPAMTVLFISSVLMIIFYKNSLFEKNDFFSITALGLFFGGAASNIIDKFSRGYIVDYLNFLDLFFFNFADAAILTGTIILGWKILKK